MYACFSCGEVFGTEGIVECYVTGCVLVSLERLTDIIHKVKKEIIVKGSPQPLDPKPNLSIQIESLIKGTFGEF